MNVKNWKNRNRIHRVKIRLLHPWPIYKRVGGIAATVNRVDGTVEELGTIADTFAKRWGVDTK